MRFHEIILQSARLESTRSFYEDVLGLEIIKGPAGFTCKTRSTFLTFLQAERNKNPFYHFAFDIPQNKFQEAKEWAKEKLPLITLDGEDEFDFRNWNAHSFYFYDPSGNIVELIARHNKNNDSSTAFSGADILSVSEIGIPVKNVKEFYEELKAGAGAELFWGDLKNFAAAGDEEGLCIIVPEGRRWYPDCPPAEIHPIIITAGTGEGKILHSGRLPYVLKL
jgi:catechol 2,3-dioxygenase-like lactoylglutathione lyase family enzyme